MTKPVVTLDCKWLNDLDLAAVDGVALLCLTLKRQGRRLRLKNAPKELIEIVAFVGLTSVIDVSLSGDEPA
jgi:ABC-type transporter Mla MlaB component